MCERMSQSPTSWGSDPLQCRGSHDGKTLGLLGGVRSESTKDDDVYRAQSTRTLRVSVQNAPDLRTVLSSEDPRPSGRAGPARPPARPGTHTPKDDSSYESRVPD